MTEISFQLKVKSPLDFIELSGEATEEFQKTWKLYQLETRNKKIGWA